MGGGGANYGQMGMAGTGAILGGIGDIIAAQNYKRPKLPPATGYEKRLRDLAQSAYIGGGQELLGGVNMYNQMAPLLMGMLPGMTYVPGSTTSGGGTDGTGTSGGGQTSPLGSYQDSLNQLQQNQALQQQRQSLKAQIKGAKKGPGRWQMKQQVKALNKQIKGMPRQADLERAQFMAGTAIPQQLFDIRQGAPSADISTPPSGSMAAIRGLIDGYQGNTPSNLLDLYRGAMG